MQNFVFGTALSLCPLSHTPMHPAGFTGPQTDKKVSRGARCTHSRSISCRCLCETGPFVKYAPTRPLLFVLITTVSPCAPAQIYVRQI